MNDPKDDAPQTLLDWFGLRKMADMAKPRWVGAGVTVALTLLFVIALVAAVMVLVHTIGQSANPETAGPNLGAGALIAALLGAPFLIWATVIKQTTLNFQKEGHITDRISKAVEQLGAEKTVKVRGKDGEGKDITIEETKPNIEVRIGAILSLERIAQDSTRYDNGRDHVRVMEILCAYVRENAPASRATDHGFGEWVPLKDDATDEGRAAHLAKRRERFGYDGLVRTWAQSLPPPREDITQALKVIGRRNKEQLRVEARWGKDAKPDAEWVFDRKCPALPAAGDDAALTQAELEVYKSRLSDWSHVIRGYAGYRADLRNTNLQKADLSGNMLSGAIMSGARMEGANLWLTRVEGASLSDAWIDGADLAGAQMQGVDLNGARMEGAHLYRARMEGADVYQARMAGAYCQWERMEVANLSGARMEWANLSGARMEGAHVCEARMVGANLNGARIEGADLANARMEGAKLRAVQIDAATNLYGAVLTGAQMRSVDLRSVNISQAQLEQVFSDGSVTDKLPEGRTWPAHWPTQGLPDGGEYGFNAEYEKWRADPTGYTPPPL
jgi:uncharacterized protein YjbI with pentapeptide repeats